MGVTIMIPTSIDGTDITGATIDGQDVEEITVDGQTVFSGAPPIIDSFEDGNLSEYSGSTGSYNIVNSPVFDGSNALQATSPNDDIHRTDAVSPGDTVAVYYRAADPADNAGAFRFGYNGSSGYEVNVSVEFDNFRIRTAAFSTLASDSSLGLSQNEWYRVEVDYRDSSASTIEATLIEDSTGTTVSTISTTNSATSNTGFGFRNQTNVVHDFVIGPL